MKSWTTNAEADCCSGGACPVEAHRREKKRGRHGLQKVESDDWHDALVYLNIDFL